MDNLTHALVGLAMGHAGLKRRTPLALTTLAVAANAPDIDVAVFATSVLPMYFRRGWTHGPIAMVVLPLVVAAAVVWWDRRVRQRRASPPPPVVPREILLPAQVIDRANHAAWLVPVEQRPLPTWEQMVSA